MKLSALFFDYIFSYTIVTTIMIRCAVSISIRFYIVHILHNSLHFVGVVVVRCRINTAEPYGNDIGTDCRLEIQLEDRDRA